MFITKIVNFSAIQDLKKKTTTVQSVLLFIVIESVLMSSFVANIAPEFQSVLGMYCIFIKFSNT